MEYKVTTADFEHFIADWLNSDNNSFQDYVKGVKLFRQYLDERNAAPTKEG